MMRIEELEDEVYGLACAVGSLQADMAELRELVRDMWRTFMGGNTTAAQRAELRERMRELGVGFDG